MPYSVWLMAEFWVTSSTHSFWFSMNKRCNHCKQFKPLGDYFTPPKGASSSWQGTSEFCKQCHSEGKIPNGYGDQKFGDKWNSPDDSLFQKNTLDISKTSSA